MKKNKKFTTTLKQLTSGLPVGVILGIFLGVSFITFEEKGFTLLSMDFILIAVSVIVSFFFTIFIHELGHLVMGYFTGYKFLSFRFLNFHLQYDDNKKLKLYRHSIPGTLGQCLMTPPNKEPLPAFWYHFGGVLFNLLAFLINYSISFFVGGKIVYLLLLIFSMVNLFMGVLNWMPTPGTSNDGYNYRAIKKNDVTRIASGIMLDVNGQITHGARITSIDLSRLETLDLDYKDFIQANTAMFLMSQKLLKFDFEGYNTLLDKISILKENPMLAMFIDTDIYFLKLLEGEEDYESYKTNNVKKMFKALNQKEDVKLIVLFEDLLLKGSYDEKMYQEFVDACHNSITPGISLDLLDFGNIILGRTLG